ncbi:MAG: hypothetical protein ACI4V1_09240, partial [Eubacteriales bacterium]
MKRYDKLRAEHRCVRCGCEDAFTMNGRALCAECAEKNLLKTKEYYSAHRDELSQKAKKRYYSLKERGLCTICGRRRAKRWHTQCEVCLSIEKARYRRKYVSLREERNAKNVCLRCGKAPRVDGLKVCAECRGKLEDMARRSAAIRREKAEETKEKKIEGQNYRISDQLTG